MTHASPGVGRIADCSADASDCSHPLSESLPGGAGETRRRLRGGRGDRADADCSALGSTTPVLDPSSTAGSRAHASRRAAGSECGQDCADAVKRGSGPSHVGRLPAGSDDLSACSGSDHTVAGNPPGLGGSPPAGSVVPGRSSDVDAARDTDCTDTGGVGGKAAPRVKA